MYIDPALMSKAKAANITLTDANHDGQIDGQDLSMLQGTQVPGVSAPLGSPEAVEQFKTVQAKATTANEYHGKSLNWGEGGRSELLRDKLVTQGHSVDSANSIVKANYLSKISAGKAAAAAK